MRSKLSFTIIAIALTTAIVAPLGYVFAGGVASHPNLAAAEASLDAAFEKITAAQKANEYDMDGHAAKAKDAIALARDELKLAAAAADKHARTWKAVFNQHACMPAPTPTCLPAQKPGKACPKAGDSCIVGCGEDLVCE